MATAEQQRARLAEMRRHPTLYEQYLSEKRREYKQNKARYQKSFRAYYEENKESLKQSFKKYYQTHKAEFNKRKRELTESARKELLALLGVKCVRCGMAEYRCLVIEHKRNGGRKDRARFHDAYQFYKYYLARPKLAKKKLQVMCANCNTIKEWNRRYRLTTARKRVVENLST